ncbi:hypothetical protein M2273_000953 [Mucilaginibacter lappiensis]
MDSRFKAIIIVYTSRLSSLKIKPATAAIINIIINTQKKIPIAATVITAVSSSSWIFSVVVFFLILPLFHLQGTGDAGVTAAINSANIIAAIKPGGAQ